MQHVRNQERQGRSPAQPRRCQSSPSFVPDTQPHSSLLTWSQRLQWCGIKPKNALIGLPAWLIFIIASNSNPYYSHTISRLPPKELFHASELLTQQSKHIDPQRLWCYSCNIPALQAAQNWNRGTGLPFWVFWMVLINKELNQPYKWMLCWSCKTYLPQLQSPIF